MGEMVMKMLFVPEAGSKTVTGVIMKMLERPWTCRCS
jgi:hypothetical protein